MAEDEPRSTVAIEAQPRQFRELFHAPGEGRRDIMRQLVYLAVGVDADTKAAPRMQALAALHGAAGCVVLTPVFGCFVPDNPNAVI